MLCNILVSSGVVKRTGPLSQSRHGSGEFHVNEYVSEIAVRVQESVFSGYNLVGFGLAFDQSFMEVPRRHIRLCELLGC